MKRRRGFLLVALAVPTITGIAWISFLRWFVGRTGTGVSRRVQTLRRYPPVVLPPRIMCRVLNSENHFVITVI